MFSKSYKEAFEKFAKNRCWKGYKPVKGKKPYSEDSCEKISEDKTLYQPKPSSREGKKYMVYVKGDSGNPKLIHFGAKGYKHNYSDGAKKNFRARHNCDSAQKDSAKWWACNYLWNKKQEIGSKTYEKVAELLSKPEAMAHVLKKTKGNALIPFKENAKTKAP